MDPQLRHTIIQELDLTDLPNDEADEIITGIGSIIMEVALGKVTDSLDDKNVISFEKILQAADGEDKQDQLDLFFEEHVPNMDEIIAESSKEVIFEYKKSVGEETKKA